MIQRIFTFLLLAILCAPVQAGPTVEMPGQEDVAPPNPNVYQRKRYPWRTHIVATIFWVGEAPTARNKTPNHKSSWDTKWQENFGGYDNPDPAARVGYRPKGFIPGLNPFYVALPYNDSLKYNVHKPEAARVIPWFKRAFHGPGKSVCKGRWIEIYYNGKRCYAQWSDCGPWVTDDWKYVFGGQRPKNQENKGAGIDVSPAVRDFLGMKSGAKVHWRFIEFAQVPRGGPWAKWGKDNPFVNPEADPDRNARKRYLKYLTEKRDREYRERAKRNLD